jgi:hypothetical protein
MFGKMFERLGMSGKDLTEKELKMSSNKSIETGLAKSGKPDMDIEDEDEVNRKEKGPRGWVNTEEVNEEDYEKAWANLREDMGEESSEKAWAKLGVKNQDLAETLETDFENEYDPLGLESRTKILDIEKQSKELIEAGRKERQEKREKEAFESLPDITLEEYRSLKEAVIWSGLAGMEPELKTGHPVDLKGKKLEIDQITKLANQYRENNNRPKKTDYKAGELELMKKCARWNYLYRKINETQKDQAKHPRDPKGGLLSDKQIKEEVKEFTDFRNEHPDQFAELKYLNQEWQKDEFKWKLSEHDGRPIWVFDKSLNLKFKDGKKQEIKSRYVVSKIPTGAKPKDFATSYYTVKNIIKDENGVNLVIIDLKPSQKKKVELEK